MLYTILWPYDLILCRIYMGIIVYTKNLLYRKTISISFHSLKIICNMHKPPVWGYEQYLYIYIKTYSLKTALCPPGARRLGQSASLACSLACALLLHHLLLPTQSVPMQVPSTSRAGRAHGTSADSCAGNPWTRHHHHLHQQLRLVLLVERCGPRWSVTTITRVTVHWLLQHYCLHCRLHGHKNSNQCLFFRLMKARYSSIFVNKDEKKYFVEIFCCALLSKNNPWTIT